MKQLILSLIFIVVYSASFAQTVSFCSEEWVGFTDANGTGYYWDVLRAVYKTEGIEILHTKVPFIRCLKTLEQKQMFDGAAACFKTSERQVLFTFAEHRIHYTSYGIVYMKGKNINNLSDIKSKVGKVRGYDFSDWLPSNLDIYPLSSTVQALKMLKLERIKYFAEDLQDVDMTIRKLKLDSNDYIRKSFHTKSLFVPFTKNARGKKMADIFDSGLVKIYESGELEKIVKKYNLEISILSDFK